MLRTQVVIVGGGPAGLLLAHILDQHQIDSILLERQSKNYVLKRIRAGVLEYGTVKLLRDVGLGERMDREGAEHNGALITWEDHPNLFVDTMKYCGKQMMAYGQTNITEDLYAARDQAGAQMMHEAANVVLHDLKSDQPFVTCEFNGKTERISCDFVAACDGFHGVGRQSIPAEVIKTFERAYPFGWLGVMSETPPLPDISYAHHSRGFALASQRNPMLSRYYIQCDVNDKIDQWSDDRFWEELKSRFPAEMAAQIITGPSIEKSIAPLRSFVAEPMQYGRMYLAGDAAHIVPPTGAKGLNLAVSDVYYLSRAFAEHYRHNNDHYLETYSATALSRVWSSVRLSWWMTSLLHVFPDEARFDRKIHANEYEYLLRSEHAQATLAEQYVGLPFDD
ncbi:MAG: 4-hydroxybenzoate 3-monooxygenase [Burkholderiaceae bacterium]